MIQVALLTQDYFLKRDSSSPATWDYLGAVVFQGQNDDSFTEDYASILGRIKKPYI